MSEELSKETAAQLKSYAVLLKQAGYLFYDSDGRQLSSELRQKALQLHYYATKFMMSRDGYNIELIFNADNARMMLAGGDSYEDFVNKVKAFDLPIKCNVVWDELAVAYRCYTCGLNVCMSMCVKCFEAGNHEGHDYNRFFSSSGGKCDCGDEEVVLESGFCNKHGKKNNVPSEMPIDLSAMIEFIMIKCSMKLVGTLRCFCRRSSIENRPNLSNCVLETVSDKIMKEAVPVLGFLDETMSLASPCIDLMAKILCDKDLYTQIEQYSTTTHLVEEATIAIEEMDQVKRKEQDFLKDVSSLKNYVIPESLISRVKFLPRADLRFECLLDELMFYQARTGYPQPLINFLLKLLPNYEFKVRFAQNFFRHYDSIERLLYEIGSGPEAPTGTHVPSRIASRVVHISVQICSSQRMCDMLQQETNILRRVLESALRMIFNKARPLDIADPSKSWFGLNMDQNEFIETSGYCAATTDLQNLFAHPNLLGLFFEDPSAAEEYVLFVSALEGINSLERIAHGDHIEMDVSSHAQRLYQFEMEVSIAFIHQTMFVNYDCIKHRFFATFLINKLKEFFNAVLSDAVPLIFHNNRASFHIPLHRQLAVVCTKYFVANNSLDILPDDVNLLRALVAHPLRLQAIVSEFFAGMWSRNGSVMSTNIILYLHASFKIFLDNDLALIRLVATKLRPFEITRLMYKAYHLSDCLTYCCQTRDNITAPLTAIVTNRDWVPFMLDGYLKLLLELVFVRSLAEETIEEELRLQIIHVLAAIEKAPYSRIRNYFNYIQQIDDALFERILNEVAQFVRPETGTSAQQGHFVLRPEFWLGRVDLVQAKHRASSQREYNTIILRQEKELAKNSPNLGDRTPWPYYRLPELERDDLIFTKTSHVLLQPANVFVCRFIIEWYLYSDLSVHLLQQAIYTLNLTLKLASLPSATKIELEFLSGDNLIESKESHISTYEQSQSRFFALFNETPTRALYPKAKEVDSFAILLIKLFYKLHAEEFSKTTNKTQAAKMLQKICQQNLSQLDQVIGSGVDYVGRLIAWLFNSDPVSQQIIKDEVFSTNVEASSPTTQSLLDKKMAARKRQMELLQMQKAKQSALLKRLADQEGVSDDEMETDQAPESTIVCSICNDNCDIKSMQKPFGLLVFIQSGSVTEDYVTASTSSEFVIGETQMETFGQALEGILMATYRDFENEAIPCFYKSYTINTVFSLLPYCEIKTCGHHAHLSCYETYRKTVLTNTYFHRKFPPPCPICRTNISYIIPFSSKSNQGAFADFDEIYTNEEECFAKLLQRFQHTNLTTTAIPPDSLSYYKKLEDKIIKMVRARESMRSTTEPTSCISTMLDVYEKNSALLPLSLIKNYVDRITTIEENDYKFSERLKGVLTEHLYFMACCDSELEPNSLFAAVWAKLDGHGEKFNYLFNSRTMASLLHYDSQSLLVICSAALTIFNLSETARLGLFRVCFKFLLAHCFVRSITIALLHRPVEKHRPILNALLSSHLSTAYSQVSEYLVQTSLLNSTESENANAVNVIAETINNTVSTNLAKFLQFSLNLASELQLVLNVTTPKRGEFGYLYSHCLNMILGQEMQLTEIIQAVNGSSSRINRWLNDFLSTAVNLQPCYADTVWDMKKLRCLPQSFDTLFKAYFDQKCTKCDSIPSQPMICLVCGRLLCLDSCCEQQIFDSPVRITEVEAHANSCSSGSACFLHVTSTMVILYHKRFVSIFQSPYLDRHFEEDRNLRRGKTLYLSAQRYEKLQQLWIAHNFERNPNSTNPFPIDSLHEVIRQVHNL